MKIKKLINYAQNKLKNTKTPCLDSEVLLSYVLKKPREYVLTNPNDEVTDGQKKHFEKLIEKRAKHEPVAYLTKHKEFYGRDFYIDKRVHIPRPATEDLIDCVKDRVPINFAGTIADIGTGSGCIAITLAHEYPKAKIIATDISQNALNIAQRNAKNLKVTNRIAFLRGDLLKPLQESADIIIANLPYGWQKAWPDTQSLNTGQVWTCDKEVFFQPKISFNGGKYGLELIKKIIQQLPKHMPKHGQAFLEFDPRQKNAITWLLLKTDFNLCILKDSENHDRIASIAL